METTDIGLAEFIYSSGKEIEIDYTKPRQCVFKFEDCPEVKQWQSGQARGNVLAFLNSYKILIGRVKNYVTNAKNDQNNRPK